VRQSLYSSVLVLLVALAGGFAQEQAAESTPSGTTAAVSAPKAECAGFIAAESIPKDLVLYDGADNDHHQPLRQFSTGDYVYLRIGGGTNVTEGSEYRIVRRANELYRNQWYSGEQWLAVHSLGRLYEDTGRVKVSRVTPNGAVAEVTFACGPIYPGDIAVPFKPRLVPEYAYTTHLDEFAPANDKLVGKIVAAGNDTLMLGTGSIAYLDLGEADGARPGQRYRIFRTFKDHASVFAPAKTPREVTGELVILSTERKSSVAIVVNSIREIGLRDGVELE
jgi:hypothetical protein